MRNMSFMLTTEQIRNHTKTQTRRIGWKFLKTGDRLNAVKKCMGLKKGEKIELLAIIEVTEVWREPLCFISPDECLKEGFPEYCHDPDRFINMFCKEMKCTRNTPVTVISFKYIV